MPVTRLFVWRKLAAVEPPSLIAPMMAPYSFDALPTRGPAIVVRPERFGDPWTAYQVEEIDLPADGPLPSRVFVVPMFVTAEGNHVRLAQRSEPGRKNPIEIAKDPFRVPANVTAGPIARVPNDLLKLPHFPRALEPGDPVWIDCGGIDRVPPEYRKYIMNDGPRWDRMRFRDAHIPSYDKGHGHARALTEAPLVQVHLLPPGMTYEQAAAAALVAPTAVRLIRKAFGLSMAEFRTASHKHQGEWAAVFGAGSGVNSHTVAFLKYLGINVVAIVSSEAKARFVKEVLGADVAVTFAQLGLSREDFENLTPERLVTLMQTKYKDAKKELARQIGGQFGVHAAIDTTGKYAFGMYLLAKGGRYVFCGSNYGDANYDVILSGGLTFVTNTEFVGSHYASYAEAEWALRMIASGRVRRVPFEIRPISAFGETIAQMGENRLAVPKVVFPVMATGLGAPRGKPLSPAETAVALLGEPTPVAPPSAEEVGEAMGAGRAPAPAGHLGNPDHPTGAVLEDMGVPAGGPKRS